MHRNSFSFSNKKTQLVSGIAVLAYLLMIASGFADAAVIPNIPFTSQAPDGNWKNQMFQNGCEESSIIMATHWVKGIASLPKKEALREIQKLSEYEKKHFGTYIDLSSRDTAQLIKEYYKHTIVEARYSIHLADIIDELRKGAVVLVPVDGRVLKNPYYTPPGPERHMLLLIGYDELKKQFITHDPGTRRGKGYRYKQERLFQAIRDYQTGDHKPVRSSMKAMVVVRK